MNRVVLIGISGVTCGGKTTLATELNKLLPSSVLFYQDDYFLDEKDPRHVRCEHVNHINFDILSSLDMGRMYKDILAVIGDSEVYTSENSFTHKNCELEQIVQVINKKLEEDKIKVIIIDGFLLFSYERLLPLIKLRYFFTLDKDECLDRRNNRIYDPPDVPGYFEECVWPEYLKHLEEVKRIPNITFLDKYCKKPIDIVLKDIYSLFQ